MLTGELSLVIVLSVCLSVRLSVGPLVTSVYCGKTAEQMELPVRVVSGVGQRDRVY